MCTSQFRWTTSSKPSVAYIPLSRRLIRNDMNLGSTSLVQCDYNIEKLMMVANSALGPKKTLDAKQSSKHQG